MSVFDDAERQMIDDADNKVLAQEIKHNRFFKAYRPLVEQSLRDLGNSWEAKEYTNGGGIGGLLDMGSKKRFWIRATPPQHVQDEDGESWKPATIQITLWIGGKPDSDAISGDAWWNAVVELDGIAETMMIETQEIQCFTIAELETVLHNSWEKILAEREG